MDTYQRLVKMKFVNFPLCYIVTAFIMLHPKISIIMEEFNPLHQMDPSRTMIWSSNSNGPRYGQMFDEKVGIKYSMMICALKSAFTMISDRNIFRVSKSLWKPVSYMHFFFFLSRFLLAPKGRAKVLPKAASSRYWLSFIMLSFNEIFCFSFSVERTNKFWSFLH